MPKLVKAVLVLALLPWAPRTARAVECEPANDLSPCIDPDQLWIPAGAAHFASISGPDAAAPGTLSFGLAWGFMLRPVVLVVASPDPEGREVSVVSRALTVTPLFALGLVSNLELTLAAPIGLLRAGAGSEGLSTQAGSPLPSTSVHDPRVGLGYALKLPAPWLRSKLELALKLPLGDEAFLAGESSAVFGPGAVVEAHSGRFRASAAIGVRLRSSVELAGVRVGNQAFAALGGRFDLLGDERLSIGGEAWALPSLEEQPSRHADESVTSASYVASEWLFSVASSFVKNSDVSLLVGAGGALPLSSETRRASDGSEHTEHFAGLGTPALRALVTIRYVPRSKDPIVNEDPVAGL